MIRIWQQRLILVAIAVIIATPVFSSAAVQYLQPESASAVADSVSTATWNFPLQSTGYDLWGMDLRVGVSANTTNMKMTILCRTASNYTNACSSGEWPTAGKVSEAVSITVAEGTAYKRFQFATSTTPTIRNDRYYIFQLSHGNASTLAMMGTTSPQTFQAFGIGTNGIPYMQIFGSEPEIPVGINDATTTSRFTNVYSPANFATTNSTAVSISQQYVYSGAEGYNRVGVKLRNELTGALVPVSEVVITGAGTFTFSQPVNLQTNTAYSWQPYMYKFTSAVASSTTLGGSLLDGSLLNGAGLVQNVAIPAKYGTWKTFTTGSVYNWSDSATVGESSILGGSVLNGNTVLTEGNATTTIYGQIQSGFAIIDVISTKFPFNWAIGFGQVLSDLDSRQATTSLPEMSVDFGFLHSLQAIATTTEQDWNVDFLPASTWQQVADFTPIKLARTMCVYILWISLVMFAVREAYSIFARGQSGVFAWDTEPDTVAVVKKKYSR